MESLGLRRGLSLHSSLHSSAARDWSEPHLHPSQLVLPVFVTEAEGDRAIAGFGANMQWGTGSDGRFATLVDFLSKLQKKGLASVMLFGVVKRKDDLGEMADHEETPVIRATRAILDALPSMLVMCDVCLCEYTDHGHCGVLRKVEGENEDVIDNESTIERLANIALAYAQAGALYVCPSDMMDGRVYMIRKTLDVNGFRHVGIMSYTSKKASSMYSPFRAAVDSTFTGHRKRYQQPVGSILHARQSLRRDEEEGASIVLVKPALFYGDIIKEFAQTSVLPVACYVVSGEYVMLSDYAKRSGDLESVLRESHLGLLRAGASILITYFTPELLDYIPNW